MPRTRLSICWSLETVSTRVAAALPLLSRHYDGLQERERVEVVNEKWTFALPQGRLVWAQAEMDSCLYLLHNAVWIGGIVPALLRGWAWNIVFENACFSRKCECFFFSLCNDHSPQKPRKPQKMPLVKLSILSKKKTTYKMVIMINKSMNMIVSGHSCCRSSIRSI